ncbi:MAG: hypothetical protein ACOXZ1_03750 [Patescibacteria group bacterium]|jgi:hypothetical protein
MKKNSQKIIILTFIFSIIIWIIIIFIDYNIVFSGFKKPIFTIATETQDDGGSGTYKGLGYSFKINGNFMPDDEFPGITHVKFYLFGNKIKESLRD